MAKAQAESIKQRLSPALRYTMELASEKGTSSWLQALSLKEHGFNLSKSDFGDALCLRYGWQLPHTPTRCVSGKQFNPDHMLSCPTGGLPSLRHNEIRNYLATRLSEVCSDVAIEPTLQPLHDEEFVRRTTSRDENARLDIHARGFWRGGRLDFLFFDVRGV